jgi:hypothetical protein
MIALRVQDPAARQEEGNGARSALAVHRWRFPVLGGLYFPTDNRLRLPTTSAEGKARRLTYSGNSALRFPTDNPQLIADNFLRQLPISLPPDARAASDPRCTR